MLLVKDGFLSSMPNHTTFSAHARIRVAERLSMFEEDVALLLDHGLAVKISEEKNTNRVHLLFYSADDFQCFVAIYDHQTKTVITLLPVDYYELLNHKIAPAFVDEAKLKVSAEYDPATDGKATPLSSVSPVDDKSSSVPAPAFRLSVEYQRSQGDSTLVKLGGWRSQDTHSVEALLASKAFVNTLKSRVAQAAPVSSRPIFVKIHLGAELAATLPFESFGSSVVRDSLGYNA